MLEALNAPKARRLLEDVFALFREGAFAPLPIQAFPVSKAAAAFQFLARAKHVGKLVLMAEDAVDVVETAPRAAVDPATTCLVLGGYGGLGPVIAERLVGMGARHVALLGRNLPGPDERAGWCAASRASAFPAR